MPCPGGGAAGVKPCFIVLFLPSRCEALASAPSAEAPTAIPYTSQCTNGFANGTSGSSHTSTSERAELGTPRHASGGGIPSPSAVADGGSAPSCTNAELVTVISPSGPS